MTTSASGTTEPVADARTLGLAHHAARGVLEHVLARHGSTFQQQVVLRAAITTDAQQTRDDLVAQAQRSLNADPAGIRAVLDELLARQLLEVDGSHVRPTDAGRELFAAAGAEVAPVSARIWGEIPAEDLIAAGRVLALVTERATMELAALDT
jgi:DNA-binding MarR family transcriptional regulator